MFSLLILYSCWLNKLCLGYVSHASDQRDSKVLQSRTSRSFHNQSQVSQTLFDKRILARCKSFSATLASELGTPGNDSEEIFVVTAPQSARELEGTRSRHGKSFPGFFFSPEGLGGFWNQFQINVASQPKSEREP